MSKIQRLNIKGIRLTSEEDWENISISSQEEREAMILGTQQEAESKRLGLKDRSFSGDQDDSLIRSITAKQAEFAVRRWGGGTARVVKVNEFHNHPDVGKVNVRFTFNPGYGMIITNRDQDKVPMILLTGRCPDFKLMGWHIPAYAKQFIYKVHQGRNQDCESQFGFLQEMKDHEACQIPMQCLFPMSFFNKELLK